MRFNVSMTESGLTRAVMLLQMKTFTFHSRVYSLGISSFGSFIRKITFQNFKVE